MKIQVLIEDGAPMLVFSDWENHNKMLQVFTLKEGHSMATRAYLRRLKKPESEADINAAWQLLIRYGLMPR